MPLIYALQNDKIVYPIRDILSSFAVDRLILFHVLTHVLWIVYFVLNKNDVLADFRLQGARLIQF